MLISSILLLIFRVFRYLTYRSIRFSTHFLQKNFFWRLSGTRKCVDAMLADGEFPHAQKFKILLRAQYDEMDMSRKEDFILIHQQFFPISDVLTDEFWITYCLDENYVYFVNMGKSIRSFQARQCPFIVIFPSNFPDLQND